MKHLLLTTIAAVLVVGCGPQPPDISIHKAAEEGNIEAVKQHLAAGTDVNAKDTVMGSTPLHNAADGGQKKTAELLIASGADVNAKDEDGDTPLDWAISYKRTEIADLLRKHGGKAKAPDISIYRAAGLGNIEAVKQHLAAGTDVNAKAAGETPLHLAAMEGHKAVAELLIVKGTNVNAKD